MNMTLPFITMWLLLSVALLRIWESLGEVETSPSQVSEWAPRPSDPSPLSQKPQTALLTSSASTLPVLPPLPPLGPDKEGGNSIGNSNLLKNRKYCQLLFFNTTPYLFFVLFVTLNQVIQMCVNVWLNNTSKCLFCVLSYKSVRFDSPLHTRKMHTVTQTMGSHYILI